MKTRYGFVSNSSSSSFTMLVSVEDHEKIVQKMDENLRPYLKHFIGLGRIGSHDVVVFDSHSGEAFEGVPSCGNIEGIYQDPSPEPQFPATEEGYNDSDEFSEGKYRAENMYKKLAEELKCKTIIIDVYS